MRGLCTRCRLFDTSFRVKEGHEWIPCCRECIEPGDTVYGDLPNGELIGDVAPEINA